MLLSPVVHTIASDYLRQRKLGVRPDPIRTVILISDNSFAPWDGDETLARIARQYNHRSNLSFLLKSQCKFPAGLDMLILGFRRPKQLDYQEDPLGKQHAIRYPNLLDHSQQLHPNGAPALCAADWQADGISDKLADLNATRFQ